MDEPYHCLLYNWLVQCGAIASLRKQVDKSRTLQRLTLSMESIALLEFNSYLGNCLIGNYSLFCSMIRDVMFEELSDLVGSKNEIHCVVRPTALVHVADPAPDSNSLVNFWGSVVSVTTPPQPYTQSTKYRCANDTCTGHDDAAHIRIQTVTSRESDVINGNLRCLYCGEGLFEDVTARVIGERVSASLGVKGEEFFVTQTVKLIVRDELIQHLFLGDSVAVVGLYSTRHTGEGVHRVVEVLSVSPISVPVPSLLPGSLKEICEARNKSPWQLLSLLSYCVTPENTPQGSFHTLKQLLLLSLVRTPGAPPGPPSPLFLGTAHPKHSPALHLLIRTRDTRAIARVLDHFATLAPLTSRAGVLPLSGGRDGLSLFCGPLLSAPAGVVLVGDVEGLSKQDTETLSSALHNKAVIIGKRKSEIFPLKSAVWGYHRERGSKKNAALSHLSWDIVYNPIAESPGEVDAILENGDEDEEDGGERSLVPECDLASYLTIASTIDVQFEEGCTRLIDGYCQAAKSVRYGSGCEMPVNARQTLHLMAGNHARINFRDTALDVDAVAALKLYEECLSSHQGYSTVDAPKSTHIKPGEEEEITSERIDLSMETFYSRVVNFCTTNIPGFVVNSEE